MSAAEPTQLYFVAYNDDDGNNQDAFVAATTPEEAFALWRQDRLLDNGDIEGNCDARVSVWAVPETLAKAKVLAWPGPGESFDLNHVSLATMAATTVGDIT